MDKDREELEKEGYYTRIHSTPRWLRKLAGIDE